MSLGQGFNVKKLPADREWVRSVQVDFLTGEYGGTGKSRRTQKVLDMQPRKARGCDLAFQISPAQIPVKGKLPDGALDEV